MALGFCKFFFFNLFFRAKALLFWDLSGKVIFHVYLFAVQGFDFAGKTVWWFDRGNIRTVWFEPTGRVVIEKEVVPLGLCFFILRNTARRATFFLHSAGFVMVGLGAVVYKDGDLLVDLVV